MIASSQTLNPTSAGWLAERDSALSFLPDALAGTTQHDWMLHDVQWSPGQLCRLAYRVGEEPTESRFVALEVEPTGWSQHDYRSDPGLPGLAAASDADLVADLLGPTIGEPILRCRVQPVRYRPGARCVLRYDVLTATGANRYYAKVFTSDVYTNTAKLAMRVTAAARDSALVAPVVALWPELGTVVGEAVEGRAVSKVLTDPGMPVGDRVNIAARLGGHLAAFHGLSGVPAPIRTASDQLRGLQDVMAPVRLVDAELAGRFDEVLDRLATRIPADGGPGVLLHGGFRPGQVVLGATGALTLIDLDGVCRGDAAQDLATALGHLWWQAIRQPAHRATLQLAEQAFVSEHQRWGCTVDPACLTWWRTAALLQVAARRFRRLDISDWTSLPPMIDMAEKLLTASTRGGALDRE